MLLGKGSVVIVCGLYVTNGGGAGGGKVGWAGRRVD